MLRQVVPTHRAHISSMIFCNGRRQNQATEKHIGCKRRKNSNMEMTRLTGGVSMTVGWKPPEVASKARLLE